VQDAFATAVERWPRDGVPRNPGAWIVAAARNRAIDLIRRERNLQRKTELLARVDDLAAELDGYRHLHSARADLLRRLGRADEAAAAYRRALELTASPVEQRFLRRRLAELP
jgi:RNA polymerase sigma-70 factor (ECF subfamily)